MNTVHKTGHKIVEYYSFSFFFPLRLFFLLGRRYLIVNIANNLDKAECRSASLWLFCGIRKSASIWNECFSWHAKCCHTVV